jgi:carbon monoxide dehydrogenase subunit G
VARITTTLTVPVTPEVAFDHIADFTTTADWDPGIARSERLDAGALGVGARFEVAVRFGSRTLPFVYTITTYERATHVVLETRGRLHRGGDDVRLRAVEGGTEITWSAEFAARGALLPLEPLLAVGFRSTVAKAVAGLEASLTAKAG